MNFLVDAQLPRRMTAWLAAAGCNAIHTLDLPDANRTSPSPSGKTLCRATKTPPGHAA